LTTAAKRGANLPRESGRGDPEASRREVMAAAAHAFMERGYAATSLDHVAVRLGATKGRVYHYFPSKADLFLGIHKSAMETLDAAVRPIAEGPGAPAERLHAMAMAHARMLMTHSPQQKVSVGKLERHLLRGATARHQRTLQAIVRLRDGYEQLFADVLAEGMGQEMGKGVFEDLPPRLAAKPVLGALNWLTVWYQPRRGESAEDIEVIARLIADFVVKGLRRGDPL
jgi:AcrR family transcriptional regulator